MNAIDSTLPVGTKLKGKYEIKCHLSSGGFGNTYLAVYGSLKEKVAVKEFFMRDVNEREDDGVTVSISRRNDNAAAFLSQIDKFKKEARRLSQINNIHVVKVHDLFEENGTAYYVMDFVNGYDLSERLNRRKRPYAEKTIVNYLRQILDGLDAVHSKGLLHLDIKPKNIMLTSNGYVKLIDFGASKEYIAGAGATIFSGIAMTKKYAPPEQIDGSYDKMGPWSDFYALGATLYKLLTLQEPPTYTMIYEDPSKAFQTSEISDKMKTLVVWMMQPNRTERPQDVSEIIDFLDSTKTTTIPANISSISPTTTVTVGGDNTMSIYPPKEERPHTHPQKNGKDDEFSPVGCVYMIAIVVIIALIIKYIFLT